jgi:hypothetical protein
VLLTLDYRLEGEMHDKAEEFVPTEVAVTPISNRITFMNLHDVCVDPDGNFYVPQRFSGRTHPLIL